MCVNARVLHMHIFVYDFVFVNFVHVCVCMLVCAPVTGHINNLF